MNDFESVNPVPVQINIGTFCMFIEYIKIASNITTKASHKAKKIFRNFLTSFNLCLKFFTLKPFGLFFSFLFNLKKIKMNNKISINSDFAFLNLN